VFPVAWLMDSGKVIGPFVWGDGYLYVVPLYWR
jgi:hypothetical protein